ncbi:MAG: acetoin utilization protein AcuC [Methanomassiliicoccales archaeon]|nr:MAG: acetoin utilization protein AcuC [Methanomassiliicoccales archaeon]
MSGRTAFFYSDTMLKYYFGPEHPFQPIRYRRIFDTLTEIGAFGPNLVHLDPPMGTRESLRLVHTDEYINRIEEVCQRGTGYLDGGDTPITETLFEGALAVTGATVACVEAVESGEFQHAMNPAGGMHHAMPERASGFCVFNDTAIAARTAQKKYGTKRIAIIDIDAHHGDGTQEIFYNEAVLKISFHRFGQYFYPRTGGREDIGKGKGRGYNINVPLPGGTQDDVYLRAYDKVVKAALDAYRPELIIHQFGTDAHFGDCLVDLGLTTKAYERIAEMTHDLAHKHSDGNYVVTGGGGYNIEAVRRTWAIVACTVSGAYPYDPEALHHLQDSQINQRSNYHREEVEEVVDYILREVIPLIK